MRIPIPDAILTLATLALVLISTTATLTVSAQSRKQKREAAYQEALKSYSSVLKAGMTRKNVEDFLKSKGVEFRQICCIDEKSAYADLLTIGKEKHPWYCEEHNVYVALQFAAVDPHEPSKAVESDELRRITIWHHLEGCL